MAAGKGALPPGFFTGGSGAASSGPFQPTGGAASSGIQPSAQRIPMQNQPIPQQPTMAQMNDPAWMQAHNGDAMVGIGGVPQNDQPMWAGGTPPWIFDETNSGLDGRPPQGSGNLGSSQGGTLVGNGGTPPANAGMMSALLRGPGGAPPPGPNPANMGPSDHAAVMGARMPINANNPHIRGMTDPRWMAAGIGNGRQPPNFNPQQQQAIDAIMQHSGEVGAGGGPIAQPGQVGQSMSNNQRGAYGQNMLAQWLNNYSPSGNVNAQGIKQGSQY